MRGDEAQKGGTYGHEKEHPIGRKGNGGRGEEEIGARLGEGARAGGGTDEAQDGEGRDAADGAEKACEESAAQEPAFHRARDEAVTGTDKVENLDDAAVGIEHRTRRE